MRSRNAALAARKGSDTTKTVDQLTSDLDRLNKILEDRKIHYSELLEAEGAASSSAKGEASSLQDTKEEVQQLSRRNAQLKKELKELTELEKQYASDPRVMDKRNEVKAVQIDIDHVEKEISTLQTVKKRRDKGLKDLDKKDAQARSARRQQHEMKSEGRNQISELEAELRDLQVEDIKSHERFGKLQDQLKLNVTTEQFEQLERQLPEQEKTIRALELEEEEWKQRKEDMRDDGQATANRQRRELLKLEREVESLKSLLAQRDAELKRTYQAGNVAASNMAAGNVYVA